MVAQFPASAG